MPNRNMITNNALITEMVLVYYLVEDLNGPLYRIALVGKVEDIDGFRREFLVFFVFGAQRFVLYLQHNIRINHNRTNFKTPQSV